ncbi:amino acid ABC transporter permease [Allorhizobium taibaishanense]|uniref:Glutamate/aspartate import permease protein GltK n=1 Tax=Allorhizobium taibaishanense TaxID=887144 RepID=A0A1Q9A7S2_9HYPH|nr:amino acid ABC transporter permease [Allorhizobium taibaishanense]MBB4008206.1 polar amino acid transport system permease protein [Allorhizobium taibaishanense]OLP50586.1 ABC transporter permease [Allorhizobium taibaishanense]
MDYQVDFDLIFRSLPVLLRGLLVTIELWVPTVLIGLTAGFLLSLARLSKSATLRLPSLFYIELFRDTPVLIQLIWFFYAFPIIIGVQLSPFVAALLGLTLNTSAYSAEIFRGGMQSIAQGQWEGARALGMRRSKILQRIILPQVFKRMLPAFTNRIIEVAKMSSLASVLSVHELMYQGRLLSSTYYRPFEILTTVAFIYFVLIYPGTWLSARLERRMAEKA